MNPTRDETEAMARALCRAARQDPDAMVTMQPLYQLSTPNGIAHVIHDGHPLYVCYWNQAEMLLAGHLAPRSPFPAENSS